MEMKIRARLFPLLLSSSLLAQAQPAIQWQRCLGGTGEDVAEDIALTTDGGSIMAGYTSSNNGDVTGNHGGADAWVVKLSSTGAIQWQRSLGGSADDKAFSVQQTTDGGYIMSGVTESNDGDVAESHGIQDAWVVKLDSTGAIDWQHPYGGTDDDEAMEIRQTSDGGYIMAGFTYSFNGDVSGSHGGGDAWVVKLNGSGQLIWQHCLGGSSSDWAYAVAVTSDGGYITGAWSYSTHGDVVGAGGSAQGGSAWVVRLDSVGTLLWQHPLGGNEGYDAAESVLQVSDGSYLMVGWTSSNDGDVSGNHSSGDDPYDEIDMRAVKLESTGNLQWQHCLGGWSWDYGYDVVETSDGGYVLAGMASSIDGDVSGLHLGPPGWNDAWVVALDSTGDLQWQLPLGGTSDEEAYAIASAPDGYLLAGYAKSNNGDVTGNHGEKDAWVVKLGPGEVGVNELENPGLTLYPNPTTGPVHINLNPTLNPSTVSLMDAMGRVLEIDRMAGDNYVLDLGSRSSGLYFVKVMFADGTQAIKRAVRE